MNEHKEREWKLSDLPIGVTDVTAENQRIVRDVVNKLKRMGHAITYDSTEDHTGKFLSARVLHYRTCRACEEINRDAK